MRIPLGIVVSNTKASYQMKSSEAGQKPTSNYQKTSISVVGDARFLMSWFIIKITTKQLESHDNV